MKRLLFFILTSVIMVACGSKQTSNVSDTDATGSIVADSVTLEEENTYLTAIDGYLVNEFGKRYAKAAYCVPVHTVVAADDSIPDDILVWGDFWVFNYNQVGDTLKCVSGGSHPGLMHVKKTEKGFEVTAFDQVEDGARSLPTAKKIFGDKYDAFHAINSNENTREKQRAEGLAEYVRKHKLTATMYQDYGWPAKKLPAVQN